MINPRCLLAIALLFIAMHSLAQFNTVNFPKDTQGVSLDPFAYGASLFSDAKLSTEKPAKKFSQRKSEKSIEKSLFAARNKSTVRMDFPLFSTTDSMLLELLKKRLTICMPLDLIKVNSPYGYRKDPFKKCQKFHDGIDLQGRTEAVFSMLPGRVHQVHNGDTGYGNYVVLDHGELRFLYGHLSRITINEGAFIDAGTIVGFVGSTGHSTGPHLHIKMQKLTARGWESVNPQPFIDELNAYMNDLNNRIRIIQGLDKQPQTEDTKPLTIANLYAALKKHGIKHPKIVLAQAILETGWFDSPVCRTKNNLFGLRHSKGYYDFDHWEESVIAYRDWVQYKYKAGKEGYYTFLSRIGYAADKNYINKVKEIAKRL